ncbi:MAG TPA: serine hydrolase domain-containing protein [Chitinophagaceae bacterium]|jgi:CubicO group peptidase (beta-lactamase class C family)|nr:serine hydrolase domain-containing protein [Chitinophagaceae bacterium]
MLRAIKPFLFIVLIAFMQSCRPHSKQQTKASIIEHLLDSLYAEKIFNGAVVINERDSIIFMKGYGYANFKDSIPFTPNTLSDGGSLAKTFTAAALWKLQKLGILSMSDAVQKYLPEYPYSNTSIIDFITHNAGGLPGYDYFFPQITDSIILTNELMLEVLAQKKPSLLDSARQGFNYENTGIDLAALIIERATGKKYQQVLSEFFFQPLKMESTHVRPALFSQWKSQRTIGYLWKNDSLLFHDLANREGFYGSCNLLFTTMDLCKWGTSFYNSKVNENILDEGKKPGIISERTTGLNQLNWYYTNAKNAYYYWGNVYGFYSHLYHDDDKKFTIAYMTNTTMPYRLRQPLAASLVEIMETGSYNKERFAMPSFSVIKNPMHFTGSYKSAENDSIKLFQGKKLLHIQKNNGLRYNMFIVDSVTAYVPGIDAWILFTEKNDKIVLHWNSVFSEQKATKSYMAQ